MLILSLSFAFSGATSISIACSWPAGYFESEKDETAVSEGGAIARPESDPDNGSNKITGLSKITGPFIRAGLDRIGQDKTVRLEIFI